MIWFVDFEASSLLPGSFPIEVAWVDMDGVGESHLIRPTEEWLDCGRGWSHQSEAVHGISLDTLMRDGEPPERVARRAAEVLAVAGAIVCSDAPGYDGGWMETLLAEGGQERGVRLANVAQLYGFACRPLLDGLASLRGAERERAEARVRNLAQEIVAGAEESERLRPRVRHRALADAEGLWRTWMAVQAEVARHLAEGGGR